MPGIASVEMTEVEISTRRRNREYPNIEQGITNDEVEIAKAASHPQASLEAATRCWRKLLRVWRRENKAISKSGWC